MKQKHILFLHQFFRHPGEPGGTRAYWVSKELISRGYKVTIITQRNSYYKEFHNVKPLERVNIDGIDVLYIKNGYSNEMSFSRRIISFLMFMFKSTWYSLKEKGISLLFEVRDLWPDIPIEMGVIRNGLLKRIFKLFEKTIYRNSIHVVALSPGMADGIARYIDRSKITMIPNVAKIDKFWPREKKLELLEKLNLSFDSFKIIHFGAMGLVNGLDYFVDAARICNSTNNRDIDFILVGPGSQKARYIKIQEEEKIENLYIFDRMPMSEISEFVNACDVSYMGVSHLYPILKHNSANKFFDSLSAGKPILMNFSGWLEDIVIRNQCGYSSDPHNPEDLVARINDLKNNPELLDTMGRNSRKVAESMYDKSILCPQFVSLVDQLLAENKN
jgi:glycosyltransferase involved in cell wall biosynthesis